MTHNDQKCRLCRVHPNTIHHIVSGRLILAKHAYLDRDNKVAAHLQLNICREFGIEVDEMVQTQSRIGRRHHYGTRKLKRIEPYQPTNQTSY